MQQNDLSAKTPREPRSLARKLPEMN